MNKIMKTNSVSYYAVTKKLPIKMWHTVIAACPHTKIVLRPYLKIAIGAKIPQTKLAIPIINVPFCGVIGN
jgi:hypothetical protein